MQERVKLVPKEVLQYSPGMSPPDSDAVIEGYLFKRSSNAFKKWNRRWFVIRNNKILYCHREIDNNNERNEIIMDNYTVLEADLRLCLVRQASHSVERRHCFELVTPAKIHLLQAESKLYCDLWIKALQRSIETALNDSTLTGSDNGENSITISDHCSSPISAGNSLPRSYIVLNDASNAAKQSFGPLPKRLVLDEILTVPGNDRCVDCGDSNPGWASVNLGVTLCIECCSCHRGLGVQVSKVRSLSLDTWESEQVKVMTLLGNAAVNASYLSSLSDVSTPISPSCLRPVRDAWIRAKYLEKRFVRKDDSKRDGGKHRRTAAAAPPTALSSSELGKQTTTRLQARNASGLERAVSMITNTDPWKLCKPFRSNTSLNTGQFKIIKSLNSSLTGFDDEQTSLCSSDWATDDLTLGLYDQTWDQKQCRLLLEACHIGSLTLMMDALACGADINFIDPTDPNGLTPLHQTVISGVVEATEYLLLNGVNVDALDGRGLTPLHLACKLVRTAHVRLLLKRGASLDLLSMTGESALDLSQIKTNTDIETMLQLARLDQEMKQLEYNNEGDETFAEVVRDISMMNCWNGLLGEMCFKR